MNGEPRKKAELWLGAVFVLGAAIGGVFGYTYSHSRVLARPVSIYQLPEPEWRAKRVAELTEQLKLTPEQVKSVDAIIHQSHDDIRTVRDKADAEVNVIREKGRDQVRQVLTPEQKPKLEEILRRHDAERRKLQEAGK